ncbi:MAG: hypothetical protein ACR2FF_08205 [Mycobacteriales bacterium]
MTGSVVVRRIGSVPARTSIDTWQAIVATIAEPSSTAHAALLEATGVASMLIAEAYTRDLPIVVTPASGQRVRLYTVHGADADEAIDDETPLATWPTTAAGWTVSLPCAEQDLAFASSALAGLSGVSVRDAALGLAVESDSAAAHAATVTDGAMLRVDTSWLES